MQSDRFIDFFCVAEHQLEMHGRLENWARCVRVTWIRGAQHPMWAKSRSNARQWYEPELREQTDTLDGHKIEKAVAQLPHQHRDALRWNYVHRGGPLHAARKIGVTKEKLLLLVKDGRQMLINRKV